MSEVEQKKMLASLKDLDAKLTAKQKDLDAKEDNLKLSQAKINELQKCTQCQGFGCEGIKGKYQQRIIGF